MCEARAGEEGHNGGGLGCWPRFGALRADGRSLVRSPLCWDFFFSALRDAAAAVPLYCDVFCRAIAAAGNFIG